MMEQAHEWKNKNRRQKKIITLRNIGTIRGKINGRKVIGKCIIMLQIIKKEMRKKGTSLVDSRSIH